MLRRTEMDGSMYTAINGPRCIRAVILTYLGEDPITGVLPPSICCVRCADGVGIPRVFNIPRPGNWVYRKGRYSKTVTEALERWLIGVAEAVIAEYPVVLAFNKELLLPKGVLLLIAKSATGITNLEELSEVVKQKWAFFDTFGQDVLNMVLSATRDSTCRPAQSQSSITTAPAERSIRQGEVVVYDERSTDRSEKGSGAGVADVTWTDIQLVRTPLVSISSNVQYIRPTAPLPVALIEQVKKRRLLWGSNGQRKTSWNLLFLYCRPQLSVLCLPGLSDHQPVTSLGVFLLSSTACFPRLLANLRSSFQLFLSISMADLPALTAPSESPASPLPSSPNSEADTNAPAASNTHYEGEPDTDATKDRSHQDLQFNQSPRKLQVVIPAPALSGPPAGPSVAAVRGFAPAAEWSPCRPPPNVFREVSGWLLPGYTASAGGALPAGFTLTDLEAMAGPAHVGSGITNKASRFLELACNRVYKAKPDLGLPADLSDVLKSGSDSPPPSSYQRIRGRIQREYSPSADWMRILSDIKPVQFEPAACMERVIGDTGAGFGIDNQDTQTELFHRPPHLPRLSEQPAVEDAPTGVVATVTTPVVAETAGATTHHHRLNQRPDTPNAWYCSPGFYDRIESDDATTRDYTPFDTTQGVSEWVMRMREMYNRMLALKLMKTTAEGRCAECTKTGIECVFTDCLPCLYKDDSMFMLPSDVVQAYKKARPVADPSKKRSLPVDEPVEEVEDEDRTPRASGRVVRLTYKAINVAQELPPKTKSPKKATTLFISSEEEPRSASNRRSKATAAPPAKRLK
ncbi:MAG: hypothetical protein M1829_003283, partial [Trizodia sp. TS-e1964]